MHTCVCVCMCVCMCVHVCACVCMCVYVCMCVNVCVWLPIDNDRVRGCVVLVATGAVLEAAAANQLVSEKNSPEVWVLARPLIGDKL